MPSSALEQDKMIEYTFKYGPFYFRIHAEDKERAVFKARRALEESFPEDSLDHLNVELTAGGFGGRLYIDTSEVTEQNIVKSEALPELIGDIPF